MKGKSWYAAWFDQSETQWSRTTCGGIISLTPIYKIINISKQRRMHQLTRGRYMLGSQVRKKVEPKNQTMADTAKAHKNRKHTGRRLTCIMGYG